MKLFLGFMLAYLYSAPLLEEQLVTG